MRRKPNTVPIGNDDLKLIAVIAAWSGCIAAVSALLVAAVLAACAAIVRARGNNVGIEPMAFGTVRSGCAIVAGLMRSTLPQISGSRWHANLC